MNTKTLWIFRETRSGSTWICNALEKKLNKPLSHYESNLSKYGVFDEEYEKYGYSFPTGENYKWISDEWTSTQAVAQAEILNEERREFVYLNPWHAAMVASLGYSFDELFKKKNHELDYDTLHNRTNIFLENYIKEQLS